MKVIIVDDEPKAISLLASYLSHFSDFELAGTFRNGLKALEFLNSNTTDVVFLDISMPHLSGLSLSRMIDKGASIVFTTAYSEHALESYDVNAADYLLKPITLERFSKTITKLIERNHRGSTQSATTQITPQTIFIKSGLETHQVVLNDILYLKKDGNYIYYFLENQKIMARQSVSEALDLLSEDFLQIQKSYIVNFRRINKVTTEEVLIDKLRLPIGQHFKEDLMARLNN